jgi:hypothetical protein
LEAEGVDLRILLADAVKVDEILFKSTTAENAEAQTKASNKILMIRTQRLALL